MKKTMLIKTFLCSEWTISRQICCYSCILIQFTLLLALCSCLFLYSYTYSIFTQDYPEILEEQNLKQIKNFIKIQQLYTQDFFEDKIRQLENLNNLFNFIQQDGFAIDEAFRCLDDMKLLYNPKLTQSVFCCGIGNKTIPFTSNVDLFLNFTAFMTEIKLSYNFRQPYYTSITDDAFFGITNFLVKPSAAKIVPIHQRSWYLNHIKNMANGNSTIQSPPFLSADYMISFALTTNLTHKNGSLSGIGGQNQDLRYIPKFVKKNIKFSMVNDNDQLIISPLYYINLTEIFKIDNESLTGISKEYWKNIKNELKNSDIQIKKKTETNVISVMKIPNPFSYVILEIDNSEYVTYQNEILKKMEQDSDYILKLTLIIDFGLLLVILMIQSCLLKLFNRGIYSIMKTSELKIYQHYFSDSVNQMLDITNKISYNLYKAYLKLLSCSNFTSTEVCQHIEDLNYPKQTYLYYNIEEIFDQCLQLQDKRLNKKYGLKYVRLIKLRIYNPFKYPFRYAYKVI